MKKKIFFFFDAKFFFQINDTSCDYGLFSPIINQTRFLKNFDMHVSELGHKWGEKRKTRVAADPLVRVGTLEGIY